MAKRDLLHFAHMQIISVCRLPLTLISLSNLGSEVLGLYIYGCLYLRDGDQGKSLSTQMFTSPIRFTLIYFWEPAKRRWSAAELAGGVGDEKL